MTPSEFLRECDEVLPACEWEDMGERNWLLWNQAWETWETRCASDGPSADDGHFIDEHMAVALREKQAREWLEQRGISIIYHGDGVWLPEAMELRVLWRDGAWHEADEPAGYAGWGSYHAALIAAIRSQVQTREGVEL